MFTYEYPRPAVTADIVLFDSDRKRVLLIRRSNEPYKDCWAFPGGFFDMTDSDIEHTAVRELQEETGLSGIELHLVGVFSKEGRDPRGRTVTVAFMGLVDSRTVEPHGGDDAAEAHWFDLTALPPLAFDHAEILGKAVARL
ncbi:MAG: NUDIX hydrolase [Bacteroidales bacterium]|nr:NUDIX hydrolase [Bacteroidales bacterium]